MDPSQQQKVQIDPSKLTPADRMEVTQALANEAQKTNIQTAVHHLADVCWKKCIPGKISGGDLDKNEASCATNCVDRWMDSNLAVLKHLDALRGGQ